MKYISLFAGIGGFDLALDRLGYECVWANEWNKYAGQIYKKQFGELDQRDITTVKTSEIPDHDLLVGGFPCQAFSIAGKRRGFDDTRGTLFFEIARILKDKQPKYFILENVKGLLSHNKGDTFRTIIVKLTELGYDLQWQVLNSKNFGVPQNRERVFIVGHLRGQPRPKVFPIGTSNGANAQGVKRKRITSSRTRNFGSSGQLHQPDEQCSTLTQSMGTGGNNVPCMVIPTINPDREDIRQSRRFKEDGDPSYTLVSKFVNGVCDGVKIRRLTPTECERLQGFPDGWTEGISDTQRYKCLGNAVTVNVVYEIARRLSGNTT